MVVAALAWAGGGRAHAQWGMYGPGGVYANPGFYNGFGGYGAIPPGGFGAYGYSGYGVLVPGAGFGFLNPMLPGAGQGYSAYGLLPYSSAIGRARENAVEAVRMSMWYAQPRVIYQPATIAQQRAMTEALLRYRPQVIEPHARQAAGGGHADAVPRQEGAVYLLPKEKVIDASGRILWPAAAPNDPKLASARQAAEAAVQKAAKDYATRGQISIHTAVEARDKVAAFGTPALENLRARSPADAAGMEVFLQSLDYTLNMMAAGQPQPSSVVNRIDQTPGHGGSTAAEIRRPAPAQAPAAAPAGTPAPAPTTTNPQPSGAAPKPTRRIDLTPR